MSQPPNRDDDLTPRKGIRPLPTGDECRNGHLDWEVIARHGRLIKRCRICHDERPFEGEVVPSS